MIMHPKPKGVLIFLVGVCILTCCSTGIGQIIPPGKKNDVRLWTGRWQTKGDASWQTSFACGSGDCTSELEYHNIDASLLSLEIDVLHYAPLVGLNFLFAVAPITNGQSQDTDYKNNRKTSESRNPVDGRVDLWSLEGRMPLTNRPLTLFSKQNTGPILSWQWQWILGAQHYQDSLRMYDGRPLIKSDTDSDTYNGGNQESPIPYNGRYFAWLDSHYNFTWNAIKIGFKSTLNLTKSSIPLCHSLEIGGKVTPLLAHYLGEGIWNLRDDFAQNPSFRHKAYGYGLGAEIAITYHPWQMIGFELGWQYLFLTANSGTDTTYYYSGEKGTAHLDEVRLLRNGWRIRSSISF